MWPRPQAESVARQFADNKSDETHGESAWSFCQKAKVGQTRRGAGVPDPGDGYPVYLAEAAGQERSQGQAAVYRAAKTEKKMVSVRAFVIWGTQMTILVIWGTSRHLGNK